MKWFIICPDEVWNEWGESFKYKPWGCAQVYAHPHILNQLHLLEGYITIQDNY